MPKIASLFVTRLYRADLSELGEAPDAAELENSCLAIAEEDERRYSYLAFASSQRH